MIDLIWGLDDDPFGNVHHIAEHGLSKDDVAHAVGDAVHHGVSASSGHPLLYGPAENGRLICVVYEQVDDDTIYPITAYPIGKD